MRRRPRQKKPPKVIRLWSRANAVKAVPYLRSVMQSLRECWIEARGSWLETRRLARAAGRPSRDTILAQEFADKETDRATDRLNDIVSELEGMDVFCLDPGRGLALVPFSQNDELAWLVFDLFSPEGFESWRFHRDPLECRRPLIEMDTPASNPPLIA